MNSNYEVSVDGPSFYTKHKIFKKFGNLGTLKGKYGVMMHEAQMIDSRLNFNALLTASIDKFIPGMRGATLVNYVECRDLLKNKDG